MVVRPDEDELLDDLPPMDGGLDEDEPPVDEFDPHLADPEAAGDPFDDATGEAEPVLAEDLAAATAGAEGGWLVDAGEAETLDIGAPEIAPDEVLDLLRDVEEPGVEGEDFGVGDDSSAFVLDGGEEGPDRDDEELREEDLPRIDADESDDTGSGDAPERWFAPVEEGDAMPPWHDLAWNRVAGAGEVPWREAGAWGGGPFESAARADKDSVLVVTRAAGGAIERRKGSWAQLAALELPEGARGPAGEAPSVVALRGQAVAAAQPGAAVVRSLDGRTFTPLEGTARASAITFSDDEGTLLIALRSPADDRAWLVHAPAQGAPHIVAELGDEADADEEVRVTALVWDPARGGVWAVGPFGAALLRPRG